MEWGYAGLAALPDERYAGHAGRPVDAKKIVAANLNAWMAYAKDQGASGGSVKGLSGLSGVSRPTIDDIRAGVGGCGVDTLEALAGVYGLLAWQMLVPAASGYPPQRPVLGDTQAAEAEIEKRARARAAEILREATALHDDTGKARRDGRSVRKPFHLGPIATLESGGHVDPIKPPGKRKAKGKAKARAKA